MPNLQASDAFLIKENLCWELFIGNVKIHWYIQWYQLWDKNIVRDSAKSVQNSLRTLKKDLSNDKVERFITGGGSAKIRTNENHPLMILAVKKNTPLNNNFDSSADYFGESYKII